MPIYDYKCPECGHIEQDQQQPKDGKTFTCPHCKAELRQVFPNPAFVLTGTGFYGTDYKKK